PPACPDNTRKAPSYLFLLSPAAYLKADIGPAPANMAQFENEARPAFFPKPTQATSREDSATEVHWVAAESLDAALEYLRRWHHDFIVTEARCLGMIPLLSGSPLD